MARGPRKWSPLFSLVGMAGGGLSGLGLLVVLQQAGRVYPTLMVTVLFLVGGLVWGIVLPSLARLVSVSRTNRRYARRAAPATQRPVTGPPQPV